MKRLGLTGFVFAIFLLNSSAFAQDFTFEDLTDTDFKKVVQDLSTSTVHTSVSGASPLGDIWGFEVGVVGSQANTPEIDKLVKRGSPGSSAEKLPSAQLLGVVSVPFAITGEIGLIPKVGSDDFKFSAMHLAAKWSPSELFFELPLSVAAKVQYSKINAEFKDTINNVATSFKYDDSILGIWAIASKNFMIVEPYIGLGYMKSDGSMDVNTSLSNVFTGGRTSASASPSTTAFMVGTEVKLLIFKAGVEYLNAFDTSRFSGKLSFYF